jgi:hypothetical protein
MFAAAVTFAASHIRHLKIGIGRNGSARADRIGTHKIFARP